MNELQPPPGPWPPRQQPSIGTGEGEVPLAKPPTAQSMQVRTMASDVASLQATGGTQPRPYTPSTPASGGTPSAPSVTATKPTLAQPPVPPNVTPLKSNGTSGVSAAAGGKKRFLTVTLAVLGAVGLGAVGYFVAYPLLSGTAEPVVEPAPVPATPKNPEPVQPAAPETPPSAPVAEPAAAPAGSNELLPTPAHTSLFRTPADLTEDITLVPENDGNLMLDEHKKQISFDTAEVSILRELNVGYRTRGMAAPRPITLEESLSTMAPSLFDRDTIRSFGNDVTFFTYTDAKGTWPGFAVRAAPGEPVAALQAKARLALEAPGKLVNLFLSDPGSPSAWQSGSVSGSANRYQTYALPSAALNYAWTADQVLVVGTSYDGFRAMLARVQ